MIVRDHASLLGRSRAVYSDCERYRYLLTRIWTDGPRWLYIMLNPSTATEIVNEATIERCQRRAIEAGAGSMTICNLFAWRSTDPKHLANCSDPVGPENDKLIMEALMAADHVICGWGNDRLIGARGDHVLRLIRAAGRVPHAIKLNANGSPAHPLYLPYSAVPVAIP